MPYGEQSSQFPSGGEPNESANWLSPSRAQAGWSTRQAARRSSGPRQSTVRPWRRRRPKGTWRTSPSSPPRSSTGSSASTATRTSARSFTSPPRLVRARPPSRTRPTVAFPDPRPRHPAAHPPPSALQPRARRQDRPRRTLPRHRRRSRAREQGRRGSSPPEAPVPTPRSLEGAHPLTHPLRSAPSPGRLDPAPLRVELRPRPRHLPPPRRRRGP